MTAPTDPTAPNAVRFGPMEAAAHARWSRFGQWDDTLFWDVLGLRLEELRADYARMRLPYRPELRQPAGVVHGGAIAGLLDTVVVPAVGWPFEAVPEMLTLSMNISYLGAVRGQDCVAEGWVTKRGRSIVFCEASARGADGEPVATASVVYKVRAPAG
ncbi:PaaI family thioesterase [Rhabdothermincola salaria]|uniref:PaaI family thioesterase n=1 Tax=Rhabdothermincola salaria TaxID=2903142 RepID=UPI001E57AAAC|nr:PaaI family thioesterase [Rhabdothermincola salaria]MCD9623620.1 PaaI family thioesterase [Rhabdothermincola salaria]